jgi:hypothetical protein
MCNVKFFGANELPESTPIYQYMPIPVFLSFLTSDKLLFAHVGTWPDSEEAHILKLREKISTLNNFRVCCWSLHHEEQALYSSVQDKEDAELELSTQGSDAMWQAYCQGGGVRIKTTIGKMLSKLKGAAGYEIGHGSVVYQTKTVPIGGRGYNPDNRTHLFSKRIPFRHESEYRFFLEGDFGASQDPIFVNVEDSLDFVDEILICPAVESSQWVSLAIYNLIIPRVSTLKWNSDNHGTNYKNGNIFISISHLYGPVPVT